MAAQPATPEQHAEIDRLLFLIEREMAPQPDLTRGQARSLIADLKRRARELDLDPDA